MGNVLLSRKYSAISDNIVQFSITSILENNITKYVVYPVRWWNTNLATTRWFRTSKLVKVVQTFHGWTSTRAGSRRALKLDSAQSNHRSLFPLGLDTVDTFSTTNPTSITYRFLTDMARRVTRSTKMLETSYRVRYARSSTFLHYYSQICLIFENMLMFPRAIENCSTTKKKIADIFLT